MKNQRQVIIWAINTPPHHGIGDTHASVPPIAMQMAKVNR
jgi:hypothetical protein